MATTLLGKIHLAFAALAIVSGAFIVLRTKGTGTHRRAGWVYALSMLSLNGTAFMLYNLFGRLGPFHLAAAVSLATIILGLIPARRRRPKGSWIEHHAYWMSWSYVGLLAAAASELTTRVPSAPFWGTVVGATLAVVAVGSVTINRRVPGILKTFGR
jgi:uncharacterized membrane protein